MSLSYMLNTCPFPGRLYMPDSDPWTSVLCLHGSEGGGSKGHDVTARFLAENGCAAFALDWCSSSLYPSPAAPLGVVDIDIEKPLAALNWIKSHPRLKGLKTGIYGYSRGAELACLIATFTASNKDLGPDAIATFAATDVVEGGCTWVWDEKAEKPFAADAHLSAWRWNGSPIKTGQPIAIELFKGPVLLLHGKNDELWSFKRSMALAQRLRQNERKVETRYFEGQGHILTAAARERDEIILDFLKRKLA